MTLAEKLRFLADRVEDRKEFYMEDRLLKYGGYLSFVDMKDNLLSQQLTDIRLLDIFQSTFKLKPQWEFTEDEKTILRNLPDTFKWMARDENKRLYIFEDKPKKSLNALTYNAGLQLAELTLFAHLFQSIQWEDEEPCNFREYI